MRKSAVWKGAISFGLVNINIELYTAIKAHSFGFKLLHEKCKTPINYKRVCATCQTEVPWSDIVKGLKLSDGSYFIINKENLEKLKPEKTDNIIIMQFVPAETVDPIYFDQHYYVLPSKLSDRAFFLFEIALQKTNKLAIGQFVLRDKQYICAIQPYKNILLLTTLNYEYEIQAIKGEEDIKIPKIETAELKLADQLINKLTTKKFDMNKFKDTFAEELKKRIAKAHKGIKLPKRAQKTKELDVKTPASLVKALKESLKRPYVRQPERVPARASAKSK